MVICKGWVFNVMPFQTFFYMAVIMYKECGNSKLLEYLITEWKDPTSEAFKVFKNA